jgi:hypothetical protein
MTAAERYLTLRRSMSERERERERESGGRVVVVVRYITFKRGEEKCFL